MQKSGSRMGLVFKRLLGAVAFGLLLAFLFGIGAAVAEWIGWSGLGGLVEQVGQFVLVAWFILAGLVALVALGRLAIHPGLSLHLKEVMTAGGILLVAGAPLALAAYELYDLLDDHLVERAKAEDFQGSDVLVKDGVVYLFGQVGPPMADAFAAAVARHGEALEAVWIDSGGGLVGSAIAIRDLIREHSLATRVDGMCASACWEIFAAGERRIAGRHAYFGCHRGRTLGIEISESGSSVPEILVQPWIVAAGEALERERRARRAENKATEDGDVPALLALADGGPKKGDETGDPAAALRMKLGFDAVSPEDHAKKARETLARDCDAVEHAASRRIGLHRLLAAGLVTALGGARPQAESAVLNEKGHIAIGALPAIARGNGGLVHSDMTVGSLLALPRRAQDAPRPWKTSAGSRWAVSNREVLAPLFETELPAPLCITQKAYDDLYRQSQEHLVDMQERCPEEAPEAGPERRPIGELLSDYPQAEGCPTEGYRPTAYFCISRF